LDLLNLSQTTAEFKRVAEIAAVMGRFGLADWLKRLPSEQLRNLIASPETQAMADQPWEVRVRLALTELGTTFIKLGQLLSTREDLIGVALADELSKLQSNTPADPPEAVREVIEAELGKPPEKLFAQFEAEAVASASVGQVHRARLPDGQLVMVKVQHPGIQAKVESDLEVLTHLATLFERHVSAAAAYRPVATVNGFRRTIMRELNFNTERRNLEEFRRNFEEDETVHFPKPFPELSGKLVLTMELLEGPSGTEQEVIHGTGGDLNEFALRAAHMYLNMIFRDGFYHADPHPGNYVMMADGVVGVIDAGMVGRIDEELRELFEDLLLALSRRDTVQLCDQLIRACAAPTGIDPLLFRADVNEFLADYAGQSLREFDLSGAIRRLTEIIRHHNLILPPGVSLVLKTLVMLESSAKQLNPEFNLMELIEPMQSKLTRERLNPKRWMNKLRRTYYDLDRLVATGPRNLADLLDQLKDGRVTVMHEHEHLQWAVNRLVIGLLAAALFVGSTHLCTLPMPPSVSGVSIPGVLGCVVAILLGGQLVRIILRDGD
jgi:ubiquinone biosynthesis protein